MAEPVLSRHTVSSRYGASPASVSQLPLPIAKFKISQDSQDMLVYSDGTIRTAMANNPQQTTVFGNLVNTAGDFRLINGYFSNLFNRFIRLKFLEETHPLADTLKRIHRVRSWQTSDIPILRAQLYSRGIDGRGTSVVVLEGKAPDNLNKHLEETSSVINHPLVAVAPGAKTYPLATVTGQYKFKADTQEEAIMLADSVGTLKNYTDRLKEVAQYASQNASIRIVNISAGASIPNIFKTLHKELTSESRRQLMLRLGFHGKPATLAESRQREIAVFNYVNRFIFGHPEFQKALQEYQFTIHQLAQQGIAVVVAMANEGDSLPSYFPVYEHGQMNFLAMSPDVISVAAADTNRTPGYYGDDVVSESSSRGSSQYPTTIAAPGERIPTVSNGQMSIHSGTSYAAPYVAGVVAMMLQVNPRLTVPRIRQILQATACSSQYASPGFINPVAAIQTAMTDARTWPLVSV